MNNIHIKNALMEFHVETEGDIDNTLAIFNSISTINIVSVNIMIKAFINHTLYCDALALYDKHSNHLNDISHIIAIEVCSKS